MTTTNDAPAPAPSGSGVRVKPLEWSCTPRLTRSIGSEPTYSIEYFHNDGGSGWELIVDEEYTLGTFKHVPLAMAKAQADYEARILSALASDASPRGEAFGYVVTTGRGRDYFQREAPAPDTLGVDWKVTHVYAHPAPATVESEVLRDLEDAILACERGTMSDVLANYRTVRRTIQDTRAALAPATEGRKG